MSTDPNALYATIAQISATFVSILGGFLLTYTLGRIAEERRLEKRFELRDELLAKVDKELEEGRLSKGTTEEEMRRAFSEISLHYWKCHITQDEAQKLRKELGETFRRELQIDQDRIATLEATIDRARDESREIGEMLEVQIGQIKIAAIGLNLLILLAAVGVVIPLFILPGPEGDAWSLLGWLAHRGSIFLFIMLLVYMFSLLLIAGNTPYYESRRQRIADLLSLVCLSVLLF